MGVATLVLLVASALGALGFMPSPKEHLVSESLLREVVERMGRDLDSYLEQVAPPPPSLDLFQEAPPSLRDQEYLHHSSLWANPYFQGEESRMRIHSNTGAEVHKSKLKEDAALPAYCNPPNPCPVGYTSAEGCLEDFENTAAFSRDYQSRQECMCDSEHMFDCAAQTQPQSQHEISQLDRLVRQFQEEEERKSLVAKKYHIEKDWNPYLMGEKLPVAAKKGQHVY